MRLAPISCLGIDPAEKIELNLDHTRRSRRDAEERRRWRLRRGFRKPINGFWCRHRRAASRRRVAKHRLSGQEALAVRASKKLRNDELLVTGFAGTRLRMEFDRVPLWRGDHVAIKQLVEDFARYLYLPRLKESAVLIEAIREGLRLLTWSQDSFAYADSFDEAAGRYRGLRCGELVNVSEHNLSGLLVRPGVAHKQRQAETAPPPPENADKSKEKPPPPPPEPGVRKPKRFHGSVTLDPTRVGRDAGRVADEVISHLVGLVGSLVKVTLEIEATIETGDSRKCACVRLQKIAVR